MGSPSTVYIWWAYSPILRLNLSSGTLSQRSRSGMNMLRRSTSLTISWRYSSRASPDGSQLFHVPRGDLPKRTVAPPLIVAADLQPVLGFRLDEPLVGDRAVAALSHRRRRQHGKAEDSCEGRKDSGCLHGHPSSIGFVRLQCGEAARSLMMGVRRQLDP